MGVEQLLAVDFTDKKCWVCGAPATAALLGKDDCVLGFTCADHRLMYPVRELTRAGA